MGSVVDPYYNTLAESFLTTLKRELVDRASRPTRESVRSAVFEYIEVFYNRRRLHPAFGLQEPGRL
jgi:putative transposase